MRGVCVWFYRAATTNPHRCGALRQQTCIPSPSRRPESEMKVMAGPYSSQKLWGIPPQRFPLPGLRGLTLLAASASHGLSVSSPLPSLVRMLVLGCRAHQEPGVLSSRDREWQTSAKILPANKPHLQILGRTRACLWGSPFHRRQCANPSRHACPCPVPRARPVLVYFMDVVFWGDVRR